jgi:hypothetical protein
MGEAKRKRISNAPCPCGSTKLAGTCCYDGREWHKPPAQLGLKDLPLKSVIEKCYMKELRSCDGGISGEHLISESVILLLKATATFLCLAFHGCAMGKPRSSGSPPISIGDASLTW